MFGITAAHGQVNLSDMAIDSWMVQIVKKSTNMTQIAMLRKI